MSGGERVEVVDAVRKALKDAGVGWRGEKQVGLALIMIAAVRDAIGNEEVNLLRRRVLSLEAALDPFARAWRVMEAVPAQYRSAIEDSDGARDHLPGVWPTVGDLRRASEALK